MKHAVNSMLLLVFANVIFSQTPNNPIKKSTPDRSKGVIIIPDSRNSKEPEANLTSHKPYEVEVYRTSFMGNAYSVRYYQMENDSLKSHSAIYCSKDHFDKAGYVWLSDTSVSIRLYNTVSKKEATFKLFGYGPMSGMETDE